MTLPTQLTTPRLRIRRAELTDRDAVVEAVRASLPELQAYMPWAVDDFGPDHASDFLARAWLGWRAGSQCEFLAFSPEDPHRVLGICGLNMPGPGSRNLGYWIRSSEAGKGLCTELAGAVVGFGFDHLELHRLRLFRQVDNVASGRVAEKLGFVKIGLSPQSYKVGESYRDTVQYSLLARDWR